MSNYYGDDFGDRMEADELMAQLEARARAADRLARYRAYFRGVLERAKLEGHAFTTWKQGKKNDSVGATPFVPADLADPWLSTVVYPDGRIEGPNAQTALDALATEARP